MEKLMGAGMATDTAAETARTAAGTGSAGRAAGGPRGSEVPLLRRGDRRRKVVLSQGALSIVVVLVVAVLWLLDPDSLFADPLFPAGILLEAGLLLLCFVVPWQRLPASAALAVPLLDFAAVGLLRAGAGDHLSGVGVLAAFPAAWIAASRIPTAAAAALTAGGSLCIVWGPLLFGDARPGPAEFLGPFLLPVVLTGLAAFISILTTERRAQQEAVSRSQAALRRAAAEGVERERLLATILDTVGVGLVVVDRDGHDVLMNARQRISHGLAAPPGNDDPNERQLLIFGPDRETPIPAEERPVRRAVQGESFDDVQIWLGSGRAQQAVSVSARAMTDDDGTFVGTVVSFTDITSLLRALHAKDDFLSNVSHEFRTPLTSVLGFLDLILDRRDSLEPDVVRYLSVARRNALQLEALVDDLLAINAGTFRVRPVQCDVGELIGACIASAQPAADAAGVRLINTAPAALPAVADPVRLGQALDNLVSNAVKYNRRGGTITVGADLTDGLLRLGVEDTGIGIEAEELSQVFDRFFRSPAVRVSTVQGVGLGLLITKSIVTEHGGTISAVSEPGQGSTFTMTLPQPS
ncbi:PAS domain-containing sensor histidine kinase [Arthrobacter crusticola]|uniref:histidine kinase n=2 Tax=Arthrobacter crusticola TaxID=2547960 RepID=A0A4R5TZY7_9MICC|nr:PAS domain-containing sensor histidine kinase [Arthrobacter crusticola]